MCIVTSRVIFFFQEKDKPFSNSTPWHDNLYITKLCQEQLVLIKMKLYILIDQSIYSPVNSSLPAPDTANPIHSSEPEQQAEWSYEQQNNKWQQFNKSSEKNFCN